MASPANTWILSQLKKWHSVLVFQRRTHVLAQMLASRIPPNAVVLDIGCGDGTVGSLITQIRPDVVVRGVEVIARPTCKIQCDVFDGSALPFAPASFDVCVLVDVLHHTHEVTTLLCEAARVTRTYVLIKDHLDEGLFDHLTLRLMDWVGNRPHGVSLPYNYQNRVRWLEHFAHCGLTEASWTTEVSLYKWPFSALFGRQLHFVAALSKSSGTIDSGNL
jgi:SAM-dependent methyltransferase